MNWRTAIRLLPRDSVRLGTFDEILTSILSRSGYSISSARHSPPDRKGLPSENSGPHEKTVDIQLAFSSIRRTVLFAAAIGGGTALAQEPSTFQKSCNNIRYGVDASGTPVVAASCLKSDNKTRVETYVALRGFQNKEGRLVAGPGTATFQKTCTSITLGVRKDDGAVVLSATCPKESGEKVETSIVLWDVHADSSGHLHYRVPGNKRVVPLVN